MARTARFAGFMLLVTALAASGPARATLGELEATADRDRAALSMESNPSTAQGEITVHEMHTQTMTIREFVAPSGKVYAVAWSGIARPNLATLLGAYHAEYHAAASGKRTGRGPRRVESAHVVVESWGHGRNLHGRAYIPSLVPPGASLNDVQ